MEIKYWTLIPNDGSKDLLKKYEELWDKIKDFTKILLDQQIITQMIMISNT